MAKKQRTTSSKPFIVSRTNSSTAALESLFDRVFAPLPDNVEAQIRALLPPEIADEDQPKGWNPFAELMWNWANRDRGESEPSDSFTQSEVDRGIAYLDVNA
jgi:hypothetical protein